MGGRSGPSYARYNYDFVDRYVATENKIGVFYNIGIQEQVLLMLGKQSSFRLAFLQ